MSKVTKKELQRDIEILHSGIGMNWTDMKKIENRLSRAMNEAEAKLHELHLQLEGQQRQLHLAAESIGLNKRAIVRIENKDEPKPQLKILDQSVFDGLDERWVAASVEENGIVRLYLSNENNPYDCEYHLAGTKYDTTDWQNSLIERDIAKEPAEVDLSSELTGSDLARAMLARGDKIVLCIVKDNEYEDDNYFDAITECGDTGGFDSTLSFWAIAIPVNNQGEPLTQSEVGL